MARLLDGKSEAQTDLFADTGPRVPKTGDGDGRASGTQQAPSGVSVRGVVPDVGSESGVSTTGGDTEVAVAPEGTGVADAGVRVGEPVRGTDTERTALSENQRRRLAKREAMAKRAEARTAKATTPVSGQAKKTTTSKQVTSKTKTPTTPAEQKKK